MNKKNYLDISLLKNQNMVAVRFAELFSPEELETFDFYNEELNKRDISKPIHTIFSKTFEDRSIEITDTILLQLYPVERLFSIKFSKGNYFQMEIKFNHTRKFMDYMEIIIAKAINFAKYKNKHDDFIVKKNIINNFAKLLCKETNLEILKELKYVSDYLSNCDDIITDSNFKLDFSIENIKFLISVTNNLIKFSFKKNEEYHYITFIKNKIGVSSITLVIEKATKNYLKSVNNSQLE